MNIAVCQMRMSNDKYELIADPLLHGLFATVNFLRANVSPQISRVAVFPEVISPHEHRVRVRCAHTPYCLSYTAVLLTFLPDESVPVCLRVKIAAESPSTQGKKCGITPSERGQ